MKEWLINAMPNVIELQDYMKSAILETLVMLGVVGVIGLILGIFFGIILVVTDAGGLYENKVIHYILDKVINIIRAIPFVILIALLVKFTRLLMGTAIGVKGAIVPLVFGIVPFISRLTEQALHEMDPGVIEAARAMGISRHYIVIHIMIPESLAGMIRTVVTSIISLLGLTAMAGSVGGGGIGSFVIRYGYNRYMTDVTVVSVLILLVFVSIVQGIGNRLASKLTH